jgi:hypothetical protein
MALAVPELSALKLLLDAGFSTLHPKCYLKSLCYVSHAYATAAAPITSLTDGCCAHHVAAPITSLTPLRAVVEGTEITPYIVLQVLSLLLIFARFCCQLLQCVGCMSSKPLSLGASGQ